MRRRISWGAGGCLAVVVGLGLLASPGAEATNTTLQIAGTVTDPSGRPVAGARVVGDVVGTVYATAYVFAGSREVVRTGTNGAYAMTLTVPAGLAERYLQVWLSISRFDASPMYQGGLTVALSSTGTGSVRPVNGSVQLSPVAGSSAFLSVTVRDPETGERLQGAKVRSNRTAERVTDGEGESLLVVPMSAASEVVNVDVLPLYSAEGVNYFNVPTNGVAYAATTAPITLVAGKLQVADVQPARAPLQTEVVGRVTDGRTGQPVPYALVSLTTGIQTTGYVRNYTKGQYAVTDSFGRYQLSVDRLLAGEAVTSMTVQTNGSFLEVTEASPYYPQQISVMGALVISGGAVRQGTVHQQDFILSAR